MCKASGATIMQKLTEPFQSMWKEGKFPQEVKDASIVHIYKRKRNRQSYDNHRRISLLSIAGKILAGILRYRLTQHLEQGLLLELVWFGCSVVWRCKPASGNLPEAA